MWRFHLKRPTVLYQRWKETTLNSKFLVTSGNKLAREFGIVFQLPAELRPIYASYGLDLRSVNADDTFELPLTATYVIDPDQKIRFAFVDADYTKRMEPEEIVAVLSEMKRGEHLPK